MNLNDDCWQLNKTNATEQLNFYLLQLVFDIT